MSKSIVQAILDFQNHGISRAGRYSQGSSSPTPGPVGPKNPTNPKIPMSKSIVRAFPDFQNHGISRAGRDPPGSSSPNPGPVGPKNPTNPKIQMSNFPNISRIMEYPKLEGTHKDHKIMDYPELERTHQDHPVQLLALLDPKIPQIPKSQLLGVLSKHFWSSGSLGAMTKPRGSWSVPTTL
ncbi:hypothetical protein WISP_01109 [Willisornis vidua]|uniref:Uncharacterized protein n=1 Tax=Willisornis vidua TaxID=1566151 RepID=A0ABQ9DZE9_9PASS|nr:hypothetical protein WISP_01109 [Willisornis vidua]